MHKEYCLGFLFDPSFENVVLIKKNRPEWQAGKLNGVGGKIEEGETPLEAMVREFWEETTVLLPSWKYVEKLSFESASVHVFAACSQLLKDVRSNTDEEVIVSSLHEIDAALALPNIPRLLVKSCIRLLKGTD